MIIERALAALDRAHAYGAPAPTPGWMARERARMAREVIVMLDVPAGYVVVIDDPLRHYAGAPGPLIVVHDPDDDSLVLRLIPETGAGGLYLLLSECPVCNAPQVPMTSIGCLADLGRFLRSDRPPPDGPDPDNLDDGDPAGCPEVPIEFFHDPGHDPGCEMGNDMGNAHDRRAATPSGRPPGT